jgi:hypothetical protein
MKLKLYAFLGFFMAILVVSCEKNQDPAIQNQTSPTNETPKKNSTILGRTNPGEECPATITQLTAGQFYNAGNVTVTNDETFIYVTYTTANGYLLTQTHLYVGGCAAVPVNNQGNPVPGQFPYQAAHNYTTSYTYQIPIANLPAESCGCIAAHSVVVKLNEAGVIIEQQTAWGSGVRINPSGNWGMKFNYCSCTL